MGEIGGGREEAFLTLGRQEGRGLKNSEGGNRMLNDKDGTS